MAVAVAVVGLAVMAPSAHAAPAKAPTYGVIASITANQPGDIAVDSASHRAYATQYGTTSLAVLDISTGANLSSVDGVVAYQSAVAVDPDLGRAYVTSSYGGAISVIDTVTGSVTKTVTLSDKNPDGTRPAINDVAVDPVTHRVYFADYRTGIIRVLDPNAADSVTDLVVHADATPTKLAFDAKRGLLYVADTNLISESYGRTLWQIDVRNGGAPTPVVRGSDIYPVELDVNDDNGYVYMTDTRTTNVWVIDPTPGRIQVLDKITLSGDTIASGVVVDSAAGIAYVADVKQGLLWSVDLADRSVAALDSTRVPELDRVKSLALDESTGAVATTTNSGRLTAIATYPELTTTSLPTAHVGQAYVHQLTTVGARTVSFEVTGAALPAGLTLANDGTISGIPTATGTFTTEITTRGVLSQTTSLTILVDDGEVTPEVPGTGGTGSLELPTGSLGGRSGR
ncbi:MULTISPECIES: YncE family protein [Rhodococcus]|uniref:YncE family protein n=1 Tax=Rhodococcus globerulus TaxID=33008 RepID=UPI001FD5C4F8|nr:YncE family protein [Rhodococcus globerulus]